jgi:hypothetical protein
MPIPISDMNIEKKLLHPPGFKPTPLPVEGELYHAAKMLFDNN